MTIRHLQIFSEVCRMESITKAAHHMNMAQPAVSSAIRELESFYQVRLFERMNRRLYITDAGKSLLGYACSILTQFDEAKEILQDIAAASPVRVGSNISFGASYLPRLMSDFTTKYPEISVRIMIRNSDDIEKCLQHNELDFAVVDDLKASPYFYGTALITEELSAVCSPDFPYLSDMMKNAQESIRGEHPLRDLQISLRDCKNIPLLLRESGSGSRDLLDEQFRHAGVKPMVVVDSVSTEALIEFCLRGAGVLIIPTSFAEKYVASGQLLPVRISDAMLRRTYYLVYHKSKYLTKSMKKFKEFLLLFQASMSLR